MEIKLPKLPPGEYSVEILGIYDRVLSAKEIMEHYKFLLKQKEIENAMSFGNEEQLDKE